MVIAHAIWGPTVRFCILLSGALVSAARDNDRCAVLTDHGSHVTADVEVGTPGQQFSLIVDTGSNALAVSGCECVLFGFCKNDAPCFQHNQSSSFSTRVDSHGIPTSLQMKFGSGILVASLGSEVMRVGGLEADMEDAFYEINGHALDIDFEFEGILGMGLPSEYMVPNTGDVQHQVFSSRRTLRKTKSTLADGSRGMYISSHASLIQRANPAYSQAVVEETSSVNPSDVTIINFIEKAGIERVAVCIKHQAPGVLNFDPPAAEITHSSLGHVHWGLDFRGVSVGDVDVPVSFCTDTEVEGSQATPCGAMLDTGSTAIRAPRNHIRALYAQICDGWPRCSTNYTAKLESGQVARKSKKAKGHTLKQLLLDCQEWWDEGVGLDELPKLYFHVRGPDTAQSLELNGWSYVVETQSSSEDTEEGNPDPRSECYPSFQPLNYRTEHNGPVWILGLPIFYEYQVGFHHAVSPPGISFIEEDCSPCQDSGLFGVNSLSSHAAVLGGRRPRRIDGKFRESHVDLTLPL